MNWIISANPNMYNYSQSFEDNNGVIDWRQGDKKYKVDDLIYIYCAKPDQKIKYKCIITQVNQQFDHIQKDDRYWHDKDEYRKSLNGLFMKLKLIEQADNEKLCLEYLIKNGLKRAPQGPMKLDEKQTLLGYINENLTDLNQADIFPEMINTDIEIYEGLKKEIIVNKYERSSIARQSCINHHGLSCYVCEMNFESTYGEIGRGFIHVHHKTPISQIGKEYKIDYKNDLIPVCPNCHAMLHRTIQGQIIDVYYLKKKLKRN